MRWSAHLDTEQSTHSSPGLVTDLRPPHSTHGAQQSPPSEPPVDPPPSDTTSLPKTQVSAQVLTSASPPQPPPAGEAVAVAQKPVPASRRPSLLNRTKDDAKATGDKDSRSRRNSWISNLSSKFSSQPPASPSAPQTIKSNANGVNAGPPTQSAKDHLPASARTPEKANRETEELQPYIPQKPKESNSSFFSSLTRRLSSNQAGTIGKLAENGGVCPRRTLNVDKNRERCLVPELDMSKLRRVSFSVDVEIAGGPRYRDDTAMSKQQKLRDKKIKERAEGETLKHPEAVKEKTEAMNGSTDDAIAGPDVKVPAEATPEAANTSPDEKPEKKQRTEEERRERKERKRRKAEENGQVPVEVNGEGLPPDATISAASTPPVSGTVTPRTQDRPTTDPVRIYRRCCQLRESPILKRITEQLMSPTCTMPDEPGVVAELKLSGSRMQLADVLTLSDWLAIVPVKRLLLEDADLTDEGVRVILAGLLAAKKPEPTKRRNGMRQAKGCSSGIVEKLTLKNNPRISRVGWKYISLFLYMCRSIKALDVSMIQFPKSTPPTNPETPTKPVSGSTRSNGANVDAAETLCKALSERLGGAQLEELTMAECGLDASQVRKVVDGAVVSGIARLGFAGNSLDDEGFDHILHYVRSGVCHALDLGSNNLRDKLSRLGEALTSRPDCPVWGLSLAGCNLSTESLKELFPSLIALRDFRFLDLSHNANLFDGGASALQLLRRNIPKLTNLKRLHLRDVGLSVKQTISLAEVVPEAKSLAHLTLLENPLLEALANATDEKSQEEACALYASLTAAARVSQTIVCIDIDVSCQSYNDCEIFLTNSPGPISGERGSCQGSCKASRGILSTQYGSHHVANFDRATCSIPLQATWCGRC